MKTTRSLLLLAAFSSALLVSSCAKKDDLTVAAEKTQKAAATLAGEVKATATESWDSIKDYTHEKREDFADSLDRMATKHEAGLTAFNARFGGLSDAAAVDRDKVSREFKEARAQLKAQLADLRDATAESWGGAKERATASWQRVQAAYEKLTAKTAT